MRVLIVALAALLSGTAHAEGGVILGIVTGNDYMKLSEAEQGAWVVGVLDGLVSESALVSKDPDGSWLGRCIGSLQVSQLQAMADQHIRSSPDAWHAPAAFLVRAKFVEFCKSRG